MAEQNTVSVNIQVNTGTSSAAVQQLVDQIGALSGAIAKTSGTIKVQTNNVNQSTSSFVKNTGAVAQANQATNSLTPSVSALTRGVFQGNLAFFAMRGALTEVRRGISELKSQFEEAISAASAQQVANAALRVSLANVGEATSGLYERIQALSSSIQGYTGIGDEVIAKNAGLLVSFGATNDNIERVTKAAVDLSTAMGKDLSGATLLIGKALQGQFTTLSRYGIVVDEGATKAHKLEQALKIIEARFGGQAAAQAQNYTGKIAILGGQFAELQESIGNAIVENADFVNVLSSGIKTIQSIKGSADGAAESLRELASSGLQSILDSLPDLIDLTVNFTLSLVDAAEAVVNVAAPINDLVQTMGGWIQVVTVATEVWVAYRAALIVIEGIKAVETAMVGLDAAMAVFTTIAPGATLAAGGFAASLWAIAAPLAGIVAGGAVLVGALYLLGKHFHLFGSEAKDSGTALDGVKDKVEAARGPLQGFATDMSNAFRESRQANTDIAAGLSSLEEMQTQMQLLANSQEGVATPEQRAELQELKDKYDSLAAAIKFAFEQSDKLHVSINSSLRDRALLDGVITPPPERGGRTPDAKGKDPKADAIKSLREEIEATKEEIRIRSEGIAQARDVAASDALVEAAKQKVKSGSEALAKQLATEKLALIDINKAQADLKKIQDELYDAPRQTTSFNNRIAAISKLRATEVSELDVKKALAAADAKTAVDYLRATGLIKEAVAAKLQEQLTTVELTKAESEHAEAIKKSAIEQEAGNNKTIGVRSQEIGLLEQVRAGTLSLEEANIRLAKAQAIANGESGDSAEILARQDLAIDKLRKKIEDTQIDLGKTLDNIFDGIVDGILQGTNKGISAMDVLKRSGQALFGDMLKGMLKDKLGFDQKFSANFLRDLPSIVQGGSQIIGGIWGGLMDLMSGGNGGGSANGGVGFNGILGGIGTIASMFGFGQVGSALGSAGSAVSLGTSVATGNIGGIVSNTGTMVSILRSLYSGFQAWSGGASFMGALDATFGGLPSAFATALSGTTAVSEGAPIAASLVSNPTVGFSSVYGGAGLVSEGASSFEGAAAATAAQGGSLAASVTTAATTFGIIQAVIAAIEAFMGLSAVEENRKSAFSLNDTRKMFMSTFDPFTLAIANFTAQMAGMGAWGGFGNNPGGGTGAANLFGAIQRIEFGGASGMDIAKMIPTLAGPLGPMLLPLFAFAAFTKPPSGGTANRVAFEGFLEEKNRKHESRRFAPFWGNVPVEQDGEWIKGNFDRSLGQDFARNFEAKGQGTFVQGLEEYIKLQGQSIGLSAKQIEQFEALGYVFKTSLGDKGGNSPQRDLATIAAMLGSLAESGANANTSMQLLKISLGRMGDPSQVFKDLNERFEDGKLKAEDYRKVIEALANLYYSGAPNLKFDLSDKNQKGLDVAKEEIDAINAAFKDVPKGVRPGLIAVDLLNKSIDDLGNQGVITFEKLDQAIQDAVASANMINPEVTNYFKTILNGANEAMKAGTTTELVDNAVNQFVSALGQKIKDTISEAIVNGFLDSSINTGVLGGFNEGLRTATEDFNNSGKSESDLAAYIARIKQLGLDAVQVIKDMGPALREMAKAAVDVGVALDEALTVDTSGVVSANDLLGNFQDFFKKITGGASEAISTGMANGFVNTQIDAFIKNLGQQIEDSVGTAIVNGFLKSNIDRIALDPFNKKIQEAGDTFTASDQGSEALTAYIESVKAAGLDAVAAIQKLGPVLRELAAIGFDIATAFAAALEGTDTATGLADAIYKLSEAQKAFNNEIDARIYALRNEGREDPAIIKRPLEDIAKEFKLTMLANFGTWNDILSAANPDSSSPFAGLLTQDDLPQFLSRLEGGQNAPGYQEQITALTKMRDLAEQDLAIRIHAYQVQAQNEIDAHNKNIDNLQKQRQQIQDNFEAEIEAKQTELDLIQDQLSTLNEMIDKAQKWKDIVDQMAQTILDMQTGQDSPFSPTARVSIAEAEFQRLKSRFEDTSLSDEARQQAAQGLSSLGPQLLQLVQAAGNSQSSEGYARYFDMIIKALNDAKLYSQDQVNKITGGKTIEELQAESNQLQEQAKTIQEDIKGLQKDQKEQLKNIDASIKVEQDAIVAVQERLKGEIANVSNNTAGVLEWIKGKGNEIFEKQTDALKEKLADLGVDSASLFGVQTDSWLELVNIRRILQGEGIKVTDENPNGKAGAFGLTNAGREELQGGLAGLKSGGDSERILTALQRKDLAGIQNLSDNNTPGGEWVRQIWRLFPETRNSIEKFQSVVSEIIHKIQDPGYQSPILGFARGGIVHRPTFAMVGEGGPEAIMPLNKLNQTLLLAARTALPDALRREKSWWEDQAPDQRNFRTGRGGRAGDNTGDGTVVIEKLEIHQDPQVTIDAEGGFQLSAENIPKLRPALRALMLDLLSDTEIEQKVKTIGMKASQSYVRRV